MGMNVDLLVIKSWVLLWSILSVLGVNLKCDMENTTYVSYVCKQPPGSEGNFTLPDDIPKTIESLSITVDEPNSVWIIKQQNEFVSYPYLNTLQINTSKSWHLSGPHSIQYWKSRLFEVPSLQILRIIYVKGYNRVRHVWTLPDALKQLYLENSIMDFDLRTTDNLFSLSLINAALTRMPDNNGLHDLAILDLRKNSLDELTGIQLASLCSLEEINLQDAKIDPCECKRINRLFDEIKLRAKFISQYNCTPSKDPSCTTNWDELRLVRESCLGQNAWAVLRKVAMLVFVVGLAIFICVFCSVWFLKSIN